MERSSLLLSAFVLNSSDEPQQLLSHLWGPVAWRWSCWWPALAVSRVCCASAPARQQRWAGGGGQRQTQIQVGFSMEQHQIWFVPSGVFFMFLARLGPTVLFLLVFGHETLFPFMFQVGPWNQNPNLARALRWSCLASPMSSRIQVRPLNLELLLSWSKTRGFLFFFNWVLWLFQGRGSIFVAPLHHSCGWPTGGVFLNLQEDLWPQTVGGAVFYARARCCWHEACSCTSCLQVRHRHPAWDWVHANIWMMFSSLTC